MHCSTAVFDGILLLRVRGSLLLSSMQAGVVTRIVPRHHDVFEVLVFDYQSQHVYSLFPKTFLTTIRRKQTNLFRE
jgi:hypothetical protein